MTDFYGQKKEDIYGLRRKFKLIGTDSDGTNVYAEYMALDSGSIGGGTTPTAVKSGKKTVTTAGTAVALVGSSTPVQGVIIRALKANTGTIYVGSASTASAANGHQLAAGESAGLAIDDLASVYIDASVSGEGVTFLGS